MIKKVARSLLCIYALQLLILSCGETDDCNCPPVTNFERSYTALEITALDSSSTPPSTIDGPVDRSSFALSIDIDFDVQQVAMRSHGFDFSGFGFATASACSCIGKRFVSDDPVASVRIEVTDVQSQQSVEITDQFSIADLVTQNEDVLSVIQAFEEFREWPEAFQADLAVIDNIPDTAIFTVTIRLESGSEFVDQTAQINFE